MRFLIIVKATAESEAGALPAEALIAQMATFYEALTRAGALLDASGLAPSSAGWRIRYDGAARTVVDGPFERNDQLIAGYTLIQARSGDEALEWAKRFPNPRGDGLPVEIELRPLYGLDDFPPSKTIGRGRDAGVGG